jgi:hypothetical protein
LFPWLLPLRVLSLPTESNSTLAYGGRQSVVVQYSIQSCNFCIQL